MTREKLSARFPVDLPAWQALRVHRREQSAKSLRDFFRRDKRRAQRFSLTATDLTLDYSKNYLTAETQKRLCRLAKDAGLAAAVERMFAGEIVNNTEGRAALHVALRAKMSDGIALDVPGVKDVWHVLNRMEQFVGAVHAGEVLGARGDRFRHIVNIGIGGSDLGTVMAARALRHHWREGMTFHSVSNVDGSQFADIADAIDPAETLVVVCSKTFTTLETMSNARLARQWIAGSLGEAAVGRHFVAASTNHEAMNEFGINPDYRFAFWDWVGGRYSIWSAVGLPLALVIGFDNFQALLAGGRIMDQHFRSAPFEQNMPVLLALIGIWYNNFFGAETQAILPYDNRLDRFPAYLQQLQMESSGKSVRRDGKPVRAKTGTVIWGEAGSNAQHSFYQLLHQGQRMVPCDFILTAKSSGAGQAEHELAIANCLAQSEALMEGVSLKELRAQLGDKYSDAELAHRVHAGGRPSNTIVLPSLTPFTLGQLIALYEHKVYVESVVWGINPFDQFGVELGKRLAGGLVATVRGEQEYAGSNASTNELLRQIKGLAQAADTSAAGTRRSAEKKRR